MAPDGKSENGMGNLGTPIPPDFKFITREYQTSDLQQMLDLVLELEAELAEKFKDFQIKSGVEDYEHRYLKPGTKYKTFVAESDGKLIGYLIGYPSVGAPEVDNMYDMLPVRTNAA
jgi:hypothetical protein